MDLPPAYWHAEWADFCNYEKLVDVLSPYLTRLHYAAAAGDGLFVAGGSRTGKSHLGAYLAKLFLSYSYTVQWADALDLQDHISEKAIWPIDRISYFERYRSVDILVIDDFGAELDAVTRYKRNRVIEIIRHRIKWNKLTIITSSVKPLDDFYGTGYEDWIMNNFKVIIMNQLLHDDDRHINNKVAIQQYG